MGTKNNPGAFDCYANAAPDEPMFVLLARDKHAPALVWLWSVLRSLDREDPAVIEEARECCAKMVSWALENGRQSVGFGQATLAGVLSLIGAANAGFDKAADNAQTTEEFVRLILSRTPWADRKNADEQLAADAAGFKPGGVDG